MITILKQDDRVASLEVYTGSKQDNGDGEWMPVRPHPRALTVNGGV